MDNKDDGRTRGPDFIRAMINQDVANGKHGGRVATRFPPEPNGYLHIGHATSICLNFGIAKEYGGTCNLRFDDTNPTTEDVDYVEAIQNDVHWMGFEWQGKTLYASDYFEQLYGFAEQLILDGKAYVDSQSEAEIRKNRGTVTQPGVPSLYRNRSVDENLDLFRRMRAGEFEDGAHVLRAKIDMSAANMKMRDPLLYRIRHAHHYRTGDDWCIYPMYDFAHPLSDAIEYITHSLCTLEFENNRAIYDWLVEHVRGVGDPEQTEFARLNLDYTVMSKRKLMQLVDEHLVEGWDDPRMPTISGLRRRGVTPESIRGFCDLIGIAKANSRVDIGKLEYSIREDLNQKAPRVMCVLRPLKVVITNYPEGQVDDLDAPYYPHDVPREGYRGVPFSRELYIERDDFLEDPPKKFFRLAPGREVRLRYAYFIKCEEVVKDEVTGEIIELRCTYDPQTRGGSAPDGRKVKGTVHWVSATHAVPVEVRLYDRLFSVPNPDEAEDFKTTLNPDSVEVVTGALIEPSVAGTPPGTHFQFERQGYFFTDPIDSTADNLVFNRVVGLRDTWAKVAARTGRQEEPLSAPSIPSEPEATAPAGPSIPSEPEATIPAGPAIPTEPEAAAPVATDPIPPRTAAEAMMDLLPDGDDNRPARSHSLVESSGASREPASAPSEEPDTNGKPGARERARAADPELAARFESYVRELGITEPQADILSGDAAVAELFEAALRAHDNPTGIANWITTEVLRELKDRPMGELPFGGAELGGLVALIDSEKISGRIAKDVFAAMMETGEDPRTIVRDRGLEQVTDRGALEPIVEALLAAHPDKVEAYRNGKTGLLGFFVGQVMRETRGTASPELVQELVRAKLA
jgi:glutaminyl-tRNA synthetase